MRADPGFDRGQVLEPKPKRPARSRRVAVDEDEADFIAVN